MAWQRTATHRRAEHGNAKHRESNLLIGILTSIYWGLHLGVLMQRKARQRTAGHRMAMQGNASHRRATHRIAGQGNARVIS